MVADSLTYFAFVVFGIVAFGLPEAGQSLKLRILGYKPVLKVGLSSQSLRVVALASDVVSRVIVVRYSPLSVHHSTIFILSDKGSSSNKVYNKFKLKKFNICCLFVFMFFLK